MKVLIETKKKKNRTGFTGSKQKFNISEKLQSFLVQYY